MNFGVYYLKYPFRKFISFLLPLVKNASPNAISWMLIPIGIVTALCYYYAVSFPILYLLGIVLIFLRLVVGTLDGAAAVFYKKSSLKGEVINRIAPELCDIMLLLAITVSSPDIYYFGILALIVAWLTSFMGLIGLAGSKGFIHSGPVAQPDRILYLALFSVAGYICSILNISFQTYKWFLLWCIVGGLITIIIRFYKLFNEFDMEEKGRENMKIIKEIKEIIGQEKYIQLGSCSASGIPNICTIASYYIKGDDTFVIVDNFFNKTKKNICENPHIALLFRKDKQAYQVKGKGTYVTTGPEYEEAYRWMKAKGDIYPAKGVVIMKVEGIYNSIPGQKAGELCQE